MGYLSCNAESAIATCDSYNWDFSKKHRKVKPFKIKEFSYSDLCSATDGFSQSNLLGKGSHGSVYKAKLQDANIIAAVKKATGPYSCHNFAHNPAENEIEILSRVRNERLVNLLGFAVDSRQRKLLVVELMPNGSLEDLIHHESEPPGWAQRVRFAWQIAKAVHFLHSSNPPVIHRDIKSSNVLIDAKWKARLGDFGLALRGHVEDVRAKCTPPAGTLGYLDPGYLAPGDLSAKSDVFSFGILLLEIISGRKAIDVNYSPPSVIDWALPSIISGDWTAICDPRIGPLEDMESMMQLAILAARCVRSRAEKRPTMTDVVECLKLVNRRVASPIWSNLGRRVTTPARLVNYEPLTDFMDGATTSRGGSRRNRKVSGVTSVELSTTVIGGFSTTGSNRVDSEAEGRPSDLDQNVVGMGRRKAGLAMKMSVVRLKKSRSTGMLQSGRLVNNNGVSLQLLRNRSVGELEESKLLIDITRYSPRKEVEIDERKAFYLIG